ncbi:hypothetical protein Val02_56650 [Virgisporangium aliadipatigenens]|uniref:DUF4097 domain-containing protein n=1 Tax=Virgisporangium aliadipatigenens TaxID=741659 RepID=A0A8J3YNG4_9ACTN|nr:DUF4097 family beta strand repeat-containing protein [Virgisporangium aliadipatigenens]GIJ48779.1 hypothetical protein Val02_56650 [Virgisporangium aliadipatigenens]
MPVFATPESISVTIDVYSGHVRLVAGDRTDTHVEVRPSNEADESDVKAAEQTRVEFADGTLTVRGPKSLAMNFSKKPRTVDVLIELPAGSTVQGDLTAGDFHSAGVLGTSRFKTSAGHVTLAAFSGDLDVSTGTGRVRVDEVGGTATVKNSNGGTDLGTVAGTLRVRAANGDISVERAGAGVDAKSSNGTIRVGEVARDVVSLHTAAGDLEVGVSAGTAAWLDLKTGFGRVHNALADLDHEPTKSEQTVEIRAHTSYGDITVRRS